MNTNTFAHHQPTDTQPTDTQQTDTQQTDTQPPDTDGNALTLKSVAFFGRALDEYMRIFSLTRDHLRGRDVLDAAAGPSSFTAQACALGCDAIALDPSYGLTVDALAGHVQIDYAKMFAQLRAKPRLYQLRTFASLNEAEESRRAASARFLNDYAAHFVHGRYVGGALPNLPFDEGKFDLVLCGHFLFTYAMLFDYEFHVAACRELLRVSREEVRIHPVSDTAGHVYPHLNALRADLLRDGIESELITVDHAFFVGANATLVLRKRK